MYQSDSEYSPDEVSGRSLVSISKRSKTTSFNLTSDLCFLKDSSRIFKILGSLAYVYQKNERNADVLCMLISTIDKRPFLAFKQPFQAFGNFPE